MALSMPRTCHVRLTSPEVTMSKILGSTGKMCRALTMARSVSGTASLLLILSLVLWLASCTSPPARVQEGAPNPSTTAASPTGAVPASRPAATAQSRTLTRDMAADVLMGDPLARMAWGKVQVDDHVTRSQLQAVLDQLAEGKYIIGYELPVVFRPYFWICKTGTNGVDSIRDSLMGRLDTGDEDIEIALTGKIALDNVVMALCRKRDIRITGIVQEGEYAKVDYTFSAGELTPLCCLLAPVLTELPDSQGSKTMSGMAAMVRYDDGWRVEEFGDYGIPSIPRSATTSPCQAATRSPEVHAQTAPGSPPRPGEGLIPSSQSAGASSSDVEAPTLPRVSAAPDELLTTAGATSLPLPVPNGVQETKTAAAPVDSGEPPTAGRTFSHLPNASRSTSASEAEKAKVVVVVDPAHGGSDSGAASGEALEKDITLAIATRMAAFASEYPGLGIVLTRDSDRDPSPSERIGTAEREGAAAYIALHVNTYSSTAGSGIETIVDVGHAAGDSDWSLALAVERAVVKATSARDRGVRAQGSQFGSLAIPAAAVYVGFITTPVEQARLVDPSYQERIARGILRGLAEYGARGTAGPLAPGEGSEGPQYAASAGEEKISLESYQERVNTLVIQYQNLHAQAGQDASSIFSGAAGAMLRLRLYAAAMSDLIRQAIYVQEANSRDIRVLREVADASLAEQYAQLLASYNLTEEQLVTYLTQTGDTLQALRSRMRASIEAQYIVNAVDAQIAGTIQPTEGQLVAYFGKNIARYDQAEQVRASHILVDTLEVAQIVREKLDAGGEFAALAKEYSLDAGTRGCGGDLGWFERGQMVRGFEEAAFSLHPGRTSSPVKTTYGYHVIRVMDRKAAHTPTLAEVRDQVAADYAKDETATRVSTWYDHVYSTKNVDVRIEIVRAFLLQEESPDLGLAELERLQREGITDDPYVAYYIGRLYEARFRAEQAAKSSLDRKEDKSPADLSLSEQKALEVEYLRVRAVSAYEEALARVGPDVDLQSRLDFLRKAGTPSSPPTSGAGETSVTSQG